MTELLRGGELYNNICGRSILKEEEAYRIIRPLTECLAYLHRMGIIHRDIKPENILLQSSGHISLSDFGTVLFLDAEAETPLDPSKRERGYTFCGSSCYLSPEVLDGEKASTKSDLWAVGCILYQLLTGAILFHDDNE